jgi:hypothetical protein
MKEDVLDNIELRSESVQDILTQPPLDDPLGKYHYIYNYPADFCYELYYKISGICTGSYYCNFSNPPEKLEARINSKIEKIFIKDHQEVKKIRY